LTGGTEESVKSISEDAEKVTVFDCTTDFEPTSEADARAPFFAVRSERIWSSLLYRNIVHSGAEIKFYSEKAGEEATCREL